MTDLNLKELASHYEAGRNWKHHFATKEQLARLAEFANSDSFDTKSDDTFKASERLLLAIIGEAPGDRPFETHQQCASDFYSVAGYSETPDDTGIQMFALGALSK